MLAVKGPRTMQNTVLVYNEAMTHGENVAYQSHLLEAVHPDSAFRADCEKISQNSNKFLDDLSLNRGVFDALKGVDVSNADSATQYFMMRTLRDFRRAGVDKDEPTRKEIAGIYEDLVKTGQDFDRNIRTDSRKIEVMPDDLAGLVFLQLDIQQLIAGRGVARGRRQARQGRRGRLLGIDAAEQQKKTTRRKKKPDALAWSDHGVTPLNGLRKSTSDCLAPACSSNERSPSPPD